LPDPRGADLGLTERAIEYLVRLNEQIQALGRDVQAMSARTSSGSLVLDDGANWRLTVTLVQGRVTAVETAASSGVAEAAFTAA
jgi:hypothetical protein